MAFNKDKQIDELPIDLTHERYTYNKQILEILAQKIEENPELRFGQILCALRIVTYINDYNDDGGPVTKDPFYIESKDTWENMTK